MTHALGTTAMFPVMGREELEAHWMPFTANREFKEDPRMIVRAEGCHFTTADGRRVFDGLSGLWCCGLGHGRSEIAQAVARQVQALDYAPAFQFGHPLSFRLANRLEGPDPRGARLRVLHRLRLRVRRHLAEDGARLLAPEGSADQDQVHRSRQGLPRRELRRHQPRRHRRQPQAVRPRRWMPITCRTRCSPQNAFSRGMPEQGRRTRRRARGADRAARCLQHRRRDRRADLGFRRRDRAAGGLPAAPARDLHEAQHPADLRRGDHRLRLARAT